MKNSHFTALIFAFWSLLFLFSCNKDSNTLPNNINGTDTTRVLKGYLITNPNISPDSVTGVISYDTINHSISLKQYYTGISYPVNFWKYLYNSAGYLTDVYDIREGEPGKNLISVFYDQNMEVKEVTLNYNPVHHIPYITNFTSNGKEVIIYDTAFYYGGKGYGISKIFYNNQGQITDRFLTTGKELIPFFDTVSYKSVRHEICSYDASGNLTVYQTGADYLYDASGTGNNLPTNINQENYSLHDTRGNELYEFEQILLKGVIKKLTVYTALIDPLNMYSGTETWYFQNIKFTPLKANLRAAYNYNTHIWTYKSFTNVPVYDSIGRLKKTTLFSSDPGGTSDIYLEY